MPDGRHPVSAVILALLLGIAVRNLAPASRALQPGVQVVVRKVLPAGIVLLGAGLDFGDLLEVGLVVLLGAAVLIPLLIATGYFLAKPLGVPTGLGLLIGVGTAICGSTAIIATAPVVEARGEDVVLSVAAVNLLGAVAMLLFPVLGAVMALGPEVYGTWCGLAIHATPQVLAAGFAHPGNGALAGEVATVVKLVRISLLGPVVFVLGALHAHSRRRERGTSGARASYRGLLPGFVVLFVMMALLRTAGLLPVVTLPLPGSPDGGLTFSAAEFLTTGGRAIIVIAMVGVGLLTEFGALARAGTRTLGLGVACAVLIGGLALIYALL